MIVHGQNTQSHRCICVWHIAVDQSAVLRDDAIGKGINAIEVCIGKVGKVTRLKEIVGREIQRSIDRHITDQILNINRSGRLVRNQQIIVRDGDGRRELQSRILIEFIEVILRHGNCNRNHIDQIVFGFTTNAEFSRRQPSIVTDSDTHPCTSRSSIRRGENRQGIDTAIRIADRLIRDDLFTIIKGSALVKVHPCLQQALPGNGHWNISAPLIQWIQESDDILSQRV